MAIQGQEQGQLFNMDAFDLGSTQIDKDKAKLTRALRFLHPYFSRIADIEESKRGKEKFHMTLAIEQDERCILMYTISRGHHEWRDGFNLVMYKVGAQPWTVISSSKFAAATEALPTDQVGPCRALFEPLVEKLLKHLPLGETPEEQLQPIYEAARHAA